MKEIYDIWLADVLYNYCAAAVKLLEIFETAENIFKTAAYDIDKEVGHIGKISVMVWERLLRKDLSKAECILRDCQKKHIRIIPYKNEEYPELLCEIYDPPVVLYSWGKPLPPSTTYVAVVGARKATDYGKWGAFETGKLLSECGISVVSGMAYGIDAYAHEGALKAGGHTVAVVGCGVDICYPAEHKNLMSRIMGSGTILSEYPPRSPCLPGNFPRRNRIISGLSKAVVIPEAGLSSGSLITAGCAAEQGRDVFVFPGNINSRCSVGANKLIQDGALPLLDIRQLEEELDLKNKKSENIEKELGADEKMIYNLISENNGITAEFLIHKASMPANQVMGLLSVLEIKGMIYNEYGKIMIAI